MPDTGATIFRFADVDWNDPAQTSQAPADMVAEARRQGLRWKRLVQGTGGFHMNRSDIPPGHEIRPHSHSHDELLVMLRGGCELSDGAKLEAGDAIVIHADHEYGLTSGPEGVEFLTIRTADASFRPAE